MDFHQPLEVILNQGLVGAMLVLALFVLAWRERRWDKIVSEKDQFIIQMLERRSEESLVRERTWEQSQNRASDALKESNQKTEQILQTVSTMVKGLDQLLFRKDGRHA